MLAKYTEDISSARELQDSARVLELESTLERLHAGKWMCEYYGKIKELSRQLTAWAMSPTKHLAAARRVTGCSRNKSLGSPDIFIEDEEEIIQSDSSQSHAYSQSIFICTGGGPGKYIFLC